MGLGSAPSGECPLRTLWRGLLGLGDRGLQGIQNWRLLPARARPAIKISGSIFRRGEQLDVRCAETVDVHAFIHSEIARNECFLGFCGLVKLMIVAHTGESPCFFTKHPEGHTNKQNSQQLQDPF
jgi:hypothetical protein